MDKSVKFSKRVCAIFLDILFLYVLLSLVTSIRIINPTYDKYQSTYESYSSVLSHSDKYTTDELMNINNNYIYNITKYGVCYNIASIIIMIGYFVFFQKYNNGQTLGKKLMKIKVVDYEGKEKVSIFRYLLRLIPIYYVFLGNVLLVLINSVSVFILSKKSFILFNSIITYIFLGLAIITLIMMLVNDEKRGLHDIMAKTIVISE